MKKHLFVIALLVGAVGLGACTKKKEETTTTTTTTTTTPEGAAAKTEVKTEVAGDTIGVSECDAYVSKVNKCVNDKIPDAMKVTFKQTMDQSMTAWKQAASTPEGKAGLATACQTALDAAKQSMGSFGCDW